MTKCTVPECISYIRDTKTSLDAASILAFIEIESSFDPTARRYEPALDESSYGLMQLLASTARGMGWKSDKENLFDPRVNIKYGVKYLEWIDGYLAKRLGAKPTIQQLVEAYNEGVGNVLKKRQDPEYWNKWKQAHSNFLSIIVK